MLRGPPASKLLQLTDHQLVAVGDEVEDRIQDGEVLAAGSGGVFGAHHMAAQGLQRCGLLAGVGPKTAFIKSNVADPEHAARRSAS